MGAGIEAAPVAQEHAHGGQPRGVIGRAIVPVSLQGLARGLQRAAKVIRH
jgi:hypothetical protein